MTKKVKYIYYCFYLSPPLTPTNSEPVASVAFLSDSAIQIKLNTYLLALLQALI